FRPAPLSQHAIVPFGFRRRVGWVTQKSVLRTSPLSERDRTAGEMAHGIRISCIAQPSILWVSGFKGRAFSALFEQLFGSLLLSLLSHSLQLIRYFLVCWIEFSSCAPCVCWNEGCFNPLVALVQVNVR